MRPVSRSIMSVLFLCMVTIGLAIPLNKASAAIPTVLTIDPNIGFAGQQDIPCMVTGTDFEIGALVVFENPGVTVDGAVNFINSTTLTFDFDINIGSTPGIGDVYVFNGIDQGALDNGFTVLAPDPPEPEGVDPSFGYTGDSGLSVQIFGNLLYSVNAVDFGPGITVDSIDNVANDVIDCTISIDWLATPGFNDVSVNGDYGGGTIPGGFEIRDYPAPQITLVTPIEACAGEVSFPITVGGIGFLPYVDFEFLPGGIDITNVNYINASQANLTVDIQPTAPPGLFSLRAFHPDGKDYTEPGAFTVLDCSPSIESIFPTQGNQGDMGLSVSIFGTSFGGVQGAVDFGSGITILITNWSDIQIDVSIDIDTFATVGFRNVTVSNFYGDDVLVNGFEVLETIFDPPLIESINPTQGYQGDMGYPVSIFGQFLDSIDTVDFGAGIIVTVTSQSEIQINVDLDIGQTAPLGFRDVFVDGSVGNSTLIDGFEVLSPAPEIIAIVPAQGFRGSMALPVAITGNYFTLVDTVDFGSGITVNLLGVTPTQIDVTLDINALATIGFRDVMISGGSGDDTVIDGFEVIVGPLTLDDALPDHAAQGETIDVVITGSNLDQAYDVNFGTEIIINTWVVTALNQIDVNLTVDLLAAVGFRDVTVYDQSMSPVVLVDGFEVTELPIIDPVISGIDPDFGYQGDMGLLIQITGQDFQQGLTVDFGHPGITIGPVNFVSDSFFDVEIDIAPAATVGFTDVVVTNPDNGDDVLNNGFEVRETIEPIVIESMNPTQGYQGDTLDVDIYGSGFQVGAIADFFPSGSFFTWNVTVVSSTQISGTLEIFVDAPIGFHNLSVTNPDTSDEVLMDAFEVLAAIIPPPMPGNLVPATVCIGAEYEQLTLWGDYFQPGIEVTIEDGGLPATEIYDVFTTFIDSSTIEITLSVTADAIEGYYDLRVENPDGQYAYGPVLHVEDCGIIVPGEGILEWLEASLDIYVDFTGMPGDSIVESVFGTIMNTGDGGFEDVMINITDLVSPDGLAITQEMVEVWPPIIGALDVLGETQVEIRFVVPVDDELVMSGGGVFTGDVIAQDLDTGEYALLPIRFTIVTEATREIEIDPLCLQVDLFGPGVPAEFVPDLFNVPLDGFPQEITDMLGGCVDEFPFFQWAAYAYGCPGYMETWVPNFTLSVYPMYPGQSPEEVTSNQPVWRSGYLTDEFIQYPMYAEPLAGFYMWQIEVEAVPIPGLAVQIMQQDVVFSDIWAFCVEGDMTGPPPVEPLEGEIWWYPMNKVVGGCGMVPETLVLSNEIVDNISADTEMTLWVEDEYGDTLMLELDIALVQFSMWEPILDLGGAGITFGINVTPNGFIGEGMGPEDLDVQIYNGGILLGTLQLDSDSNGQLFIGADVGGTTSICSFLILFPWEQHPCWEVWLDWWGYYMQLEELNCDDAEEAKDAALQALNEAREAYDAADDAYWEALNEYGDACIAEENALSDLADAIGACEDFFSGHMFSNYISFSNPGPGWSYMESFGGEVGIWFQGDQGAELLNDFIEQYSEEYEALWDALGEAREASEAAAEAASEAMEAVNAARDAMDVAGEAIIAALDAYNAALAALIECLGQAGELQAAMDFLEWWYPECFDKRSDGTTGTGLGTPGHEEGPQQPPIGESWPGTEPNDPGSGPGTGEGIGTGIGTGGNDCDCGDCDDEWADLKEAREKLRQLEQDLVNLRNAIDQMRTDLNDARDLLQVEKDRLQDASNDHRDAKNKLDTFMQNHVFSDYVGGTPASGPNYIRYKGVDIYFSDYNTFWNIFQLIKPWINELAQEVEDAKNEKEAIEADVTALELFIAGLEADLRLAEGDAIILRLDILIAEIDVKLAQAIYDACVEEVQECLRARGCPPYVPPHLTDPEGQPDQPGGVDEGASEPGGATPGGEGTGGDEGTPAGGGAGGPGDLPPGQGTGPGEGTDDCPCGDCEDEFEAWKDALRFWRETETALDEAGEAYDEALENLEIRRSIVEASRARIEEYRDAIAQLDTSDPEQAAELARLALEISDEALYLVIQEGILAGAEAAVTTAEANLTAAEQLEMMALIVANDAGMAYFKCIQRLRECERENDCVPSTLPHEREGDPDPGPGGGAQPGLEGTEALPPGFFGPGSEPFGGEIPGPGELPTNPGGMDPHPPPFDWPEWLCPCDTCEDELATLQRTEAAMYAAWADWEDELDALNEAYEEYMEIMGEYEEALAARDAARETVDELQDKLDNFVDNHVFVDGVGGDPSDGPNSITYHGVTIYFSDYDMFMNVFRMIRGGIERLAQRLAEAQAALETAEQRLGAASTAYAASELPSAVYENAAWENFMQRWTAWMDALDAYLDCIQERKQCIEDHPDLCANEPLEPGGESGYVPEDDADDEEDSAFDPDDWIEELGRFLDSLRERKDEAEEGLGDARDGLDEAGQSKEDAVETEIVELDLVGDMLPILESFYELKNDLLPSMPDSSFMLPFYDEVPEGYGVIPIEESGWFYPEGYEVEMHSWVTENEAAILELLSTMDEGIFDLYVDFGPIMDDFADAMFAIDEFEAQIAGYEAFLAMMDDLIALMDGIVDDRVAELEQMEEDGLMAIEEVWTD